MDDRPQDTILTKAAAIVDGDRERAYGDPGRNLRTIAELWTGWLRARGALNPGLNLNHEDAAMMMALVKVARLAHDPEHEDSKVDLAGYTYLMDRVQRQTRSHSAG